MAKITASMWLVLLIVASGQQRRTCAAKNLPQALTTQRIASLDKNLKNPRGVILNDVYFLGEQKMTWYSANYFCNQSGWTLLRIETVQDNIDLMGFLSYYDLLGKRYWTAGNKLEDLKTWRWGVGGKAIEYTNWGPGEPNNAWKYEYCIHTKQNTLYWNDSNCDVFENFICQKK